MRIGHFIETDLPGGAEQVLLDICDYSAKSTSITPVVFHFNHPWIVEQCDSLGIEHISIPYRKLFKSNKTLPVFAYKFSRLLKSNQINVLHSHLFGPIVGGGIAAFMANIPHLGTLHDVYMIEESPKRIYLLKLVSKLGTRLITVSKQMEKFYRVQGRFKTTKLSTIYNGIAIPPQKSTKSPSKQKMIFCCVGRLIPLKQVDKIIDVFNQLSKNEDNCELWIVGEGPELSKLENLACSDIKFLGRREDVTELLQQVDVFVQYSTTEGLSRSILEAASSSLPAIVSDVGGNSEIVLNNKTGFLVDPNDSKSLLRAFKIILQKPSLINEMGSVAYLHCKDLFERDACNQQYITKYEKLSKIRLVKP